MDLKYRSEIDGLRALAVFPVVFFHAGFELFEGGFVGVDIFFIISGYLITSIIIRELKNHSFSLINFYERRARRILPALFFVIFFVTILSYIFLSRSELGAYFKSIVSTLFFYSNFYFWKTTPYFNSESELEPLLHTWSLSIEEQFYLIFPVTLLFIFKYFRKYILFFFIFIFISSLVLCEILALKTGGTLNFYFTFSRAWELMMGSLCAYCLDKNQIKLNNKLKNFFSIIGLFLILFSIFFFNSEILHPSLYTLVPATGTALIIMFADGKTFVKKILSLNILVGIGLISYSFYLWHNPLLVFGRIYFENYTNEIKIFIILISLFFSILSFYFIEKNFRDKKKFNLYIFSKLLTIYIFVFFSFSQINVNFFSSGKKNSSEAKMALLLLKNEAIYSSKMDERNFIKNRIILETLDPKILIVGSSRVMQVDNKLFDKEILNLSVSGATIEDQIAITEMALERFSPSEIYLGADPWLFNENNYQVRWKSIKKEYQIASDNIKFKNKNKKTLNTSIDNTKFLFYESLLENIYNLFNIREPKLVVSNIKQALKNQKKIIYRDGSRIIQNIENRLIKTQIINYSMENFEFSDFKLLNYERFIENLVKIKKKKVILVLSPYHPSSYQLTIKSMPYYLDMEKKFRQLANKYEIQILGSYDAKLSNCEEKEFFDSMHPDKACMKKIVDSISNF